MVNSGFMKREVAHYMFAYFAIRCWESEKFLEDMNRESPYWALFVYFVEEMKKFEIDYEFKAKNYEL